MVMMQTSPLQRGVDELPFPAGRGQRPLTHRGEAGGLCKNRCGSTSPGTAFRHPGPLRPTGTFPGTRRCHRCRGRESRRWPWPSASRPLGHTAGREHQRRAPRRPRHLHSPVGPRVKWWERQCCSLLLDKIVVQSTQQMPELCGTLALKSIHHGHALVTPRLGDG